MRLEGIMNKTKVFIASSSESLGISRAINTNLDHEYEVTAWNNGSFALSTSSIDSLVKKSSTTDFAIFVFQPDDLLMSRGQQEQAVRDNVLFELGLFIGSIGVERCFIVKPRGKDLKLPSDLLGLTMADYEPERSDSNMVAALATACHQMDTSMKKLGSLNRKILQSNETYNANPPQYKISETGIKVLSNCLESLTSLPDGKSFDHIANDLKTINVDLLRIQLIKLERMALIEKSIRHSTYDGEPYYSYSITDAGVERLLDDEAIILNQLKDEGFKDIPF